MSYNGVKKRLPKRRKPMRKRLLALALLMALVIAIMWLPYFAPPEWMRSTVETELTKALGEQVRLEAVRLLGWRSAELRGLTIGHFDDPLAELPQVRVSVSLIGLLRGNFDLREIRMFEPSLFLVRNYDGAWNIERLLQSEGSGMEGRISLPEINISNALISVKDLADNSEKRISNVNIEVQKDFADDAYRFFTQGTIERDENPLTARLRGNIQIRLFQIPVGTGGVLALNNASIAMGYADAELENPVRNAAAVVYWDQFGLRMSSQLSLFEDRIWLSYSDLGPADGFRTPQVRIQGRTLRIEQFTSFVNKYFPAEQRDEPRPRDTVLPRALLAGLKGQYEITFGEIGTPQWRFNDVRAVVGANNGVIRAHEVDMEFNGGRVSANAMLDITGDKPVWHFGLNARDIEARDNIRPIIKDILPVVEIHEPFNLEADLSGMGFENADLWENLSGDTLLRLNSGELIVGEVPAYIKRIFPVINPTDMRFEEALVNGRFRGERINVTARFITGRWEGIDTFARGQINLKEQWVDLDFGVDMLRTLGAWLRPDSELHGQTDLALFRVRGEFAEPAMLEWYQIAAQTVANMVKQILWDDPLTLLDPRMGVGEKADYFKNRIQRTLGTAVRPLLFVGDGAKSLLDGAYGGAKGLVEMIIGDNIDEDDG